jgi:hypothetical protein
MTGCPTGWCGGGAGVGWPAVWGLGGGGRLMVAASGARRQLHCPHCHAHHCRGALSHPGWCEPHPPCCCALGPHTCCCCAPVWHHSGCLWL